MAFTDVRILRVNNLSCQAGEKADGILEIGADGEFQIPAALVCGSDEGPTVLLTAGIHPGEYVGIEALTELPGRLDPHKIAGNIIILKAVGKRNFEHRYGSITREDNKNLNREFPGDQYGSVTQRLAFAIRSELFSRADYYIDLHGGDDYEEMSPYVYYPSVCAEDVRETSRKMAQQADVSYMVRSEVASGGAYNTAASDGIPSVLIERGGMGRWSLEEVREDIRDVSSILSFLGVLKEYEAPRMHFPREIRNVRYQAALQRGLWYPAKKAGDLVTAGEYLGCVRGWDGSVKEVSRADFGGVLLYQTGSLQVKTGGPMVAYGELTYAEDERSVRIQNYWTERSESFLEQRRAELHDPIAGRWMKEIESHLPPYLKARIGNPQKPLRVLDVGCGAGFFSILMARIGCIVTGIDLTASMVENARRLAAEEGVQAEFLRDNAEEPHFPDDTFDVVLTRNVTWTLPNADKAYASWIRVLKKGGVILNFDADYGARDDSRLEGLPKNHAHYKIAYRMMLENEEIKRQLPISSFHRPAWDVDTLSALGVKDLTLDMGIYKRIYLEKDDFYNPAEVFLICAEKE